MSRVLLGATSLPGLAHLVEGREAMQQTMSSLGRLLFIAGLCVAALQTDRLRIDIICVVTLSVQRQDWGLGRVHKPCMACSAAVDLHQLRKLHPPCCAEPVPLRMVLCTVKSLLKHLRVGHRQVSLSDQVTDRI